MGRPPQEVCAFTEAGILDHGRRAAVPAPDVLGSTHRQGVSMRRVAILIVVAGLSAMGASPAAAQLPEDPLPDVEVPVPEVPDVDVPELPDEDGDGGGSDSVLGDATSSVGVLSTDSDSGSSSGSGGGSGGSEATGGGGGDSSGPSGSGGNKGSGSVSCPCAAPATGYPVAGDYDKCPLEGGASTASAEASSALAASRSDNSGGGADGPSGEVLGTGAFGDDSSEPPATDAPSLGEDSGTSLAAAALLSVAALTMLVGVAGGLRAFHGRITGG
jgi:hypothetical protein